MRIGIHYIHIIPLADLIFVFVLALLTADFVVSNYNNVQFF